MMERKACTNTLHACLLTHAALHCLFVQTTPGDPQQGMSDDTYDEVRDYLLKELIDEEDADDTKELCAAHSCRRSAVAYIYNNTGLYASWSLPSGVLRS